MRIKQVLIKIYGIFKNVTKNVTKGITHANRNKLHCEWIRKNCENEQLPGAFLDMLPDRHREFIEKHVAQEELRAGKSKQAIFYSVGYSVWCYTIVIKSLNLLVFYYQGAG